MTVSTFASSKLANSEEKTVQTLQLLARLQPKNMLFACNLQGWILPELHHKALKFEVQRDLKEQTKLKKNQMLSF